MKPVGRTKSSALLEKIPPHAFRDAAAWERWLEKNHATSPGIWLLIGKKGSAAKAISIGDAGDVALCFGWIDSQRKGHDEHHFLQRFSRRTATSPWSRINVERVEALIAATRMRESGYAEIAAAKKDGRWKAAYVRQRDAKSPTALTAALRQNATARAAFAGLSKTARYVLLLPILKATTLAKRRAQIARAISDLGGA